jgi:hypothetical protein
VITTAKDEKMKEKRKGREEKKKRVLGLEFSPT